MSGRPGRIIRVADAIAEQQSRRDEVIRSDCLGTIRWVAGLDVGPDRQPDVVRAGMAVLSFPDLRMADQIVVRHAETFPYVPGLLSYREVPALMAALDAAGQPPDVLLCDGHGLAHPRRFGLACHLGVLTGLPSVGVAKSLLIGHHAKLQPRRGSWQPLLDDKEVIGAALRTRDRVAPVYVSIGHRVSLQTAIDLVLACTRGYRLPETTRAAHRLASGP